VAVWPNPFLLDLEPMHLIDIGANLTHDSFDHDRAAVIARAQVAGVAQMVVTGASREHSPKALELARQHPVPHLSGHDELPTAPGRDFDVGNGPVRTADNVRRVPASPLAEPDQIDEHRGQAEIDHHHPKLFYGIGGGPARINIVDPNTFPIRRLAMLSIEITHLDPHLITPPQQEQIQHPQRDPEQGNPERHVSHDVHAAHHTPPETTP